MEGSEIWISLRRIWILIPLDFDFVPTGFDFLPTDFEFVPRVLEVGKGAAWTRFGLAALQSGSRRNPLKRLDSRKERAWIFLP
jgi:hypothetical protein